MARTSSRSWPPPALGKVGRRGALHQAELDAIVDEARMCRRVAAHAHGPKGQARRAGRVVDRPRTFLDEEGAWLMVERGTFLVKCSYKDPGSGRAAGFGYPRSSSKMGKIVRVTKPPSGWR
jgi:hypothetical protein